MKIVTYLRAPKMKRYKTYLQNLVERIHHYHLNHTPKSKHTGLTEDVYTGKKLGEYFVVIKQRHTYSTSTVRLCYQSTKGKIVALFSKAPLSKWQLSDGEIKMSKEYLLTNRGLLSKDVSEWLSTKKLGGYIIRTQFAPQLGLQYLGCTFTEAIGSSIASSIVKDIAKKEFDVRKYRELQNILESFLKAHGNKAERMKNSIECQVISLHHDKIITADSKSLSSEICHQLHDVMHSRIERRENPTMLKILLRKMFFQIHLFLFEQPSKLSRFTT